MRWRLGLHMAVRGLVHSWGTSCMMLVAVMVGVGFQIPNTANLDGYSRELFEQGVVHSDGHVVLSSPDSQPIDDLAGILKTLRNLEGVDRVLARYVHGGVLFRKNAHLPVLVTGMIPAEEQKATGFCDRVVSGDCLTESSRRTLVVGQVIAGKLNLKVGDRVRLVLPYQEMGKLQYRRVKFWVGGILEAGGFSATDYGVFVRMPEMYRMIGWDDTATSIHLFVDQPARSAELAARARSAVSGLSARPWSEAGGFVSGAIQGNRTISAVSTSMTVLAVLVPVLALFFIQVLSERKQIAVLGAMGWTRGALFNHYLWRASLVALAGCVLGLGLGLMLCAWFQGHPIFAWRGFVVLPQLSLKAALLPMLTVFGVTLLGGLLPAWKATRSDPSRELKAG